MFMFHEFLTYPFHKWVPRRIFPGNKHVFRLTRERGMERIDPVCRVIRYSPLGAARVAPQNRGKLPLLPVSAFLNSLVLRAPSFPSSM